MYKELSEEDLENINEISKITLTDYEIKGNMILVDNMMIALKDMLTEYRKKDEELEDLEITVQECYRPIKVGDFCSFNELGLRENDFH